jgi:hypothetical protein
MAIPNVFNSKEIADWQRSQLVTAGKDPSIVKDGDFRFLRLKEVRQICGISERAIYRGINSGAFPAPIKLKL